MTCSTSSSTRPSCCVAWHRVRGNRGARTAGVDGATARLRRGRARACEAFLADLRADLKAGRFTPLPVRERMIPKPGGKLRRLGIPTVAGPGRAGGPEAGARADLRGGLPAVLLRLPPEAPGAGRDRRDPLSTRTRALLSGCWRLTSRRASTRSSHPALLDRVRRTDRGQARPGAGEGVPARPASSARTASARTLDTGTPQGGILSPLLANIALSVLDEHFAGAVAGRRASTAHRRTGAAAARAARHYRLVRYADLCRARHKSAYAEVRVMPSRLTDALVRAVVGFLLSA